MKRLLSFFLVFVMVIGLFPIATMATEEYGYIEFHDYAELKDLASKEYSEEVIFQYVVVSHDLVIENDLTMPRNSHLSSDRGIIIPENVTLEASSITCSELVVNGTLKIDSSLLVYDLVDISGTVICNNTWFNIDDTTVVNGWENVILNGDSTFFVTCYTNSMDALKAACDRATADTRNNWTYGFIVRESITISDHIVIPQNSDLELMHCSLTVDKNATLEIHGGAIVMGHLAVYDTLINKADQDTNNWFSIYPEDSGLLEIASGGTYMGNGDFFVWGMGEFDPNTGFSGIDLSLYSVTSDTEHGISWYYTYTEATEPPAPILPTIHGTYTTDLIMPAADLGVSAPDSVLRATLTFTEDGKASATWEAVDLTAFKVFFHDMFVNAYYAMAYGAGITDINEIEKYCMESTGMSVSAYMDTIVTDEAMKAAFTPASTQGSYRYAPENKAIFTDLALMDVPADPAVESSFTVGNGTLYLNAASWGKPDYTFVCTAK